MKKLSVVLMILALLAVSCAPAFAESSSASQSEVAVIDEAFAMLQREAQQDPVRVSEVTPASDDPEVPICFIKQGDRTMAYMMEVIGEPDETGRYPLYITLHGGGSDSKEGNDGQWGIMFDYYKESVTSGIYVACRGMQDVWNMHFLDESYAMYDRLIEDMILLKNADPR